MRREHLRLAGPEGGRGRLARGGALGEGACVVRDTPVSPKGGGAAEGGSAALSPREKGGPESKGCHAREVPKQKDLKGP